MGDKVELNDVKKARMNSQVNIYFMAKIRVDRKPELDEDWELFRLHHRREIEKALKDVGELKFFAIVT